MLTLNQRNEEGLDAENAQAKSLIVPGVVLYGYCRGYFGRDSYGDKRVIEVRGNQIVVEEECGALNTAEVPSDAWAALVESSNEALASESDNGF